MRIRMWSARWGILATLLVTACTYVEDSRGVGGMAVLGDAASGPPLEGVTQLDHELWTIVLASYVTPTGVAYDSLGASAEDRYTLERYLELLARIEPRALTGGDEKAAFFVNLYNATVVARVVGALGIEGPEFRVDIDNFAFFDAPYVTLDERSTSLNVLEHALLRGDLEHDSASVRALDEDGRAWVEELHADLWGAGAFDPRLHFVLNCASRSCPPLQTMALRGPALDAALEAATGTFLGGPEHGAGPDGISQIFDWFANDFVAAGYADAAAFVERYRSLDGVATDRFLPYDWALNTSTGEGTP